MKRQNTNPVIDWKSSFDSFQPPKLDWNSGKREDKEIKILSTNNLNNFSEFGLNRDISKEEKKKNKRKRETKFENEINKKNITENYFSNIQEIKNKKADFSPISISTFQTEEKIENGLDRKRKQNQDSEVNNFSSKRKMRIEPKLSLEKLEEVEKKLTILDDEGTDFISLKDIKQLDSKKMEKPVKPISTKCITETSANTSFPSKNSINQLFNSYYKLPQKSISSFTLQNIVPPNNPLAIVPYNNFIYPSSVQKNFKYQLNYPSFVSQDQPIIETSLSDEDMALSEEDF